MGSRHQLTFLSPCRFCETRCFPLPCVSLTYGSYAWWISMIAPLLALWLTLLYNASALYKPPASCIWTSFRQRHRCITTVGSIIAATHVTHRWAASTPHDAAMVSHLAAAFPDAVTHITVFTPVPGDTPTLTTTRLLPMHSLTQISQLRMH